MNALRDDAWQQLVNSGAEVLSQSGGPRKAIHSCDAVSAGGVADEWVTQMLQHGDARVFKKYSQMKLEMKREALFKLNRQASEACMSFDTAR